MWISWVLSAGSLLLGLFSFRRSRRFKRIEHAFTIERKNGQDPPTAAVTVRLISAGTEPIRADDFEGDLIIELPGAVSITSARVTKAVPEHLAPGYHLQQNRIHISPLLLNTGDTMEFHVVATGTPGEARLTARVAGIPKPVRVRIPAFPTNRRDILYRYLSVLGFLSTTVSQLPGVVSAYTTDRTAFVIGFLASLGSVWLILMTVHAHRKSRRWRH